ncbi:hypothetical protein HDU78_008684 [Chytriomyces hyalinus]|nr:hypothetical protein HDU78_008684 [Chytriomyces hyalinus]KAJ3263042.1 hypothetical protein HDU77_011464 [Chytriomyces hyalinus]
MSITHTVALVVFGMALESSARGLITATHRICTSSNGHLFTKLIAACNAFLMIQISFNVVGYFTSSVSFCNVVGMVSTTAFHCAMTTFDAYLLHKTWVMSSNRKLTGGIAILILVSRACWAVADLALSRSYIDDSNTCMGWSQNQLTAIGFTAVEVVCDVICTAFALSVGVSLWQSESAKPLGAILVSENVVRSFVILVIQTVFLFLYCNVISLGTGEGNFWVLNAAQVYIYSLALNSEFFLVKARSKAVGIATAEDTESAYEN